MPLFSEIATDIYHLNQQLFIDLGHLPEVQWLLNICMLSRNEKVEQYELQIALARTKYFFQIMLCDNVLKSKDDEKVVSIYIENLTNSLHYFLLN